MAESIDPSAGAADEKSDDPVQSYRHELDGFNVNSAVINERNAAVRKACDNPSFSDQYLALAALARSPGGLLTDQIRRIAWPAVLGGSDAKLDASHDGEYRSEKAPLRGWRYLPKHKDEDQVQLDVNRSFVYYPAGLTSERSQKLKDDLSEVIVSTLRSHPKLCYFQGFHDIVQVLLLVLGKEVALDAVVSISMFRLRDFMLPELASSLAHLELLPAILTAVDPVLARHISGTRPFFALGATLTLFAHEVESYSEIARLFDYLLTHEAVAAIYLFASIILSRRMALLEIPIDEPDMLHFTLSKLPKPLDLDQWVRSASDLMSTHPPEKLPFRAWSSISRHSVLKTTRGGAMLTLKQASTIFDLQLAEMAARERRKRVFRVVWAWRRPAGGIAVAFLVMVFSIWLQRHPTTMPLVHDSTGIVPRMISWLRDWSKSVLGLRLT